VARNGCCNRGGGGEGRKGGDKGCLGYLQQLLRGGAVFLLFHQTEPAKDVNRLRGRKCESTHFKKSENRGLQEEGSARVGGGFFGTRKRTFMGWLSRCETTDCSGRKEQGQGRGGTRRP
jgi:hypothetical protein